MNCKLSWKNYPTACVHESDGKCNTDRNCEWKSKQTFEEYVSGSENDNTK